MKKIVFVDGQEGTTGLKIHDYLSVRSDLEVLSIDPDKRKEPDERKKLIDEADIVFLCLPDQAAIQSVSLATNPRTKFIDGSTAHRTNPQWTYGLPELNRSQRAKIRQSARVSVPGCHATGFIALMNPLVQEQIVSTDAAIACHSVTGYSGGGRSLINKYATRDFENVNSPRHYSLRMNHKHLPEMRQMSGLAHDPIFMPVVANYLKGMAVSIPLFPRLLNKQCSTRDIRAALADYYEGEEFIRVMPFCTEEPDYPYIDAEGCNNTNRMDIYVLGNEDQTVLIAVLDNLGKGASGAAIQNMNLMLGIDERTGLSIG